MKFLHFLWGGLAGLLIQLFFGGSLYIAFSFIRLFLPYQKEAPLLIETILFACIYGAGWFFYWKMQQNMSLKQLGWKVFMATLPLSIPLLLFNPVDHPMAMIPISFTDYQFNFMLYITTIVLFPIYSIALWRFVFENKTKQIRKTALTFALLFLLGIGCAYTSWSIMPMFYQLF